MLNYLLVILSNSSVPFCYYHGKSLKDKKNSLISLKNLKDAVIFAFKNNLKINFLFPDYKLNKKYEEVINEVEHIKIVPLKLHKTYRYSILVTESSDFKNKEWLKSLKEENIILRLQKKHLKKLSAFINALIPKSKRINLVLLDIEKYTDKDISEYQQQLDKISENILKLKPGKHLPELNFLTDRITLEKMNNCDAGLSHLTLAPNGMLYLCPAFYYDNEKNNLGKIRNEIDIKNKQILELKYSPICIICDAYQCKRCIYLNKKLTLELNTPSSQQCKLSHAEREVSRLLLNKLKDKKQYFNYNEIPVIDYSDPFVIAEKNKFSISDFKNLF